MSCLKLNDLLCGTSPLFPYPTPPTLLSSARHMFNRERRGQYTVHAAYTRRGHLTRYGLRERQASLPLSLAVSLYSLFLRARSRMALAVRAQCPTMLAYGRAKAHNPSLPFPARALGEPRSFFLVTRVTAPSKHSTTPVSGEGCVRAGATARACVARGSHMDWNARRRHVTP